jgi:hypothetical protein
MDTVPIEVRVMRLETARAEGIAAEDVADFIAAVLYSDNARSESKGGTRPAWDPGFFCQAEYLKHVGEAAGHRFVDEHGLLRSDHRPDLLQVGSAVHTLHHDAVHLLAEFLDGANDLHAILVFHLGGEPLDAAGRGIYVGGTTGVTGHNSTAGVHLRIVDQHCEGRDV